MNDNSYFYVVFFIQNDPFLIDFSLNNNIVTSMNKNITYQLIMTFDKMITLF